MVLLKTDFLQNQRKHQAFEYFFGLRPSENEIGYLLDAYNAYHREPLNRSDVGGSFSGVRPLLKSAANPSDATREWAFERVGNVLHIYGGKWTTSQIQGEDAVKELLK